MKVLANISLVFTAFMSLVLSAPSDPHQELTGVAGSHGLQPIVPGVIGTQMKFIKNDKRIDGNRITRLHRKLMSKVEGQMSNVKWVKDKANQLYLRDTDNVDNSSKLDGPTGTTPTFHAESLQNKLTYYLMNITLGTPAQQFMVQVDTGSSDLWVPGRIIQFNGYDSKYSSTFKHLSDDFTIKYVKDSAQGYWAVEKFTLGNSRVTVNNLQFAVATSAPDATMGILGIGPIESEVSQITYPNLPVMLVRDGLISRAVFSMYMGGIESTEGTILFGGSDKAKYRKLTTLPIVSKSTITVSLDIVALTTSTGPDAKGGKEAEFNVYDSEYGYYTRPGKNQKDLTLQSKDVIISKTPLKVLLDTGTSLTYLPSSMVTAIANSFKASFESDVGMYVVHKDDLQNNPLQGINFQFENQLIYMPKDELFWPLSWFSLEPSPYYAMTILASDSAMGYNILGDSFLRNAYVIYDLDEKEIHIGQYFPSPYSHVVPV